MAEVGDTTSKTVPQSTIVGLEAPLLENIDVPSIALFLKERKIYERRVAEKNKEPGIQITPTSYKSSITDTVLEILIDGDYVDAASAENLSEDMLRKSLRKHSQLEFKKLRLDEWERIVSDVKMKMDLSDARSRIWQLVVDYKEALRDAGYSAVIDGCPEIAIRHLRQRTEPVELHTHMEQIISMERSTRLHKSDFRKYAKRLAEEAQIVERARVGILPPVFEDLDGSSKPRIEVTGESREKKRAADDAGHDDQEPVKKKRFCWNTEKCPNEEHLLKNCPRTSPEERKRIWSRIRQEAQNRKTTAE